MLKQHSMLSSSGNITQSNSSHDKIIKIDLITKHISSFSIAQRTIFILSLVSKFIEIIRISLFIF